MKLHIIALIFFSFLLCTNLFAHKNGHGHLTKTWTINEVQTVGEFVKYETGKVYLMNTEHELNAYELSLFSKEEQGWILENNQRLLALNESKIVVSQKPVFSKAYAFMYFLGGLIMTISLFFLIVKKNKNHLAYGFLGAILVGTTACNNDGNTIGTTTIPPNDIDFLTSIFGQFGGVHTSSDDEWFYISSNGLPDHNMMVGITNWQQQVPIDQDYTGNNSWAIPIQPALASSPLSTQTNLLKGAIAIGVNGIPIFNPLNNRGEDANEIGELDQWGGHCGRADDYHYHLPPTHLQSIVGAGNPIAYAVDGFPVYGETTEALDENLGRFNADSSYQYHTIKEYPYFIAAMRGKVTLDPNSTAPENQVIPQAMTRELRPATDPLRGAVITDFALQSDSAYSLTYTLNGETFIINYSWNTSGLYTYEFVNPDGSSTTETYQR